MENISITQSEYSQLIKDQKLLYALQAAGVDNWEGYDTVLDILKENESN